MTIRTAPVTGASNGTSRNTAEHHDVIVIGSGIGSLTKAVLLAKNGKKVLVLEKHKKPGGYMRCFKRFNEHYDTGAHYVGATLRHAGS